MSDLDSELYKIVDKLIWSMPGDIDSPGMYVEKLKDVFRHNHWVDMTDVTTLDGYKIELDTVEVNGKTVTYPRVSQEYKELDKTDYHPAPGVWTLPDVSNPIPKKKPGRPPKQPTPDYMNNQKDKGAAELISHQPTATTRKGNWYTEDKK